MESLWLNRVSLPERESLSGEHKADVAVIGGGMAGILTAYFLKQRGRRPVVLEAARIGSGQTGRTTAKITAQHGLIYHRLLRAFGEEKAAQYARANQRAVKCYQELVNTLSIDCDFEECASYLYALEDPQPVELEAQAAQKLGIPSELFGVTELPFPVKTALRFSGQAQFDPIKFLAAVSKDLVVYEHTPVLEIKGNRLTIPGGIVTANQVVMATHFPFVNAPGYYFMRMHQERSYVLALENAPKLHGMYYCAEEGGYSFRSAGEYLLLGGAGHRTGENKEGGCYADLRSAAKRFYPDSREAFAWSAQDCMPADGVPLIGRFSSETPELYVATGFQKWGMTSSMVSAMILSDLLEGKEPEDAKIFSPQRFNLAASGAALLEDGLQAVKGLGKTLFHFPADAAEDLPAGHGGIVELSGKKLGVYKDDQGQIFAVQARCPHLGCELSWNPDEKSWDCPCHGSRFDYQGNLLDNPAQENLHHQ